MAWKKISIRDKRVESYVDLNNKPILDIARSGLKEYENILSFGIDPKKESILYLVTDLQSWCEKGNEYKLDFYECQKDCVDGKDWWLCLKRKSNGCFEYNEIPDGIKRGLEKVFPQTYCKLKPDSRSICLKTSSNPNEVAEMLKEFLDYLKK
jgi:hypothetical protein